MKKMIKPIFMTVVILFFIVFLNRNNYYENKTILSENSIKQFEKDLKSGKEIDPKNYIIKEKNYNNNASKSAMKVSMLIEKVVNKSLNKIFDYLR